MSERASNAKQAYDAILRRFCAWAEHKENVRAAIVVGSRARNDHPADTWSDLDLLILARDPAILWNDDAWCSEMGDVWLSFREPTPDGAYERRVLYAGGWDVDYAPSDIAEVWRMVDEGPGPFTSSLFMRGYCVVVDKDGLSPHLDAMTLSPQSPKLPNATIYTNLVADTLYHLVWAAKKLLRGDLWSAKHCCDTYLKSRLLTLLTWHALATQPTTDTWVAGRHMEDWADPRALQRLPSTFGLYDTATLWRALEATRDLACWLARETAEHIGVDFPTQAAAHVQSWLASHRRPDL